MSTCSFSEEGSEANADEELLRDLDSLREVLEEDESGGAQEEEGDRVSSLAERPLEGLKLCLQKNHENQVLFKWLLRKIDKALEANRIKRQDLAQPTASKMRKYSFWKFTKGSYFKDEKGRSAPCTQDVVLSPSGLRNFYLKENRWLKLKEDFKLVEGVKMVAIEKRSYPLQEKLINAKTNEERRALRSQINALTHLSDEELFADLELTSNDWYSISYTQFNDQRTVSDCQLHWENFLDPKLHNGPWSKEEEKKLMRVANQHQCTDWKTIAKEIGSNRTAFACLKHYEELFNRSSRQKLLWTSEMDRRLREGVGKYGEKNWRAVADHVGNVGHNQCLHRWFNSTNPTIKKGRWSLDEDKLLKEAVKIHGSKWTLVACMVPSRTASQCRERWVNVLDSNLNRGKWEPDEDERLISICRRYEGGSIPWAKVAQELGRRTDAMCSFRWRSLSSTPEVVQQYARRVAEKALTKKSNLSASEIDQDMLPEACLQQVEEYKDRLINFKGRRRKSSICPSPEMILRARGEHVFSDDPSSSSLSVPPPTTSTSLTASPLATNSKSAPSTSRISTRSRAGRQTQAAKKKGTKRRNSADSAPSEHQQPPPKKMQPIHRRAGRQNEGDKQDASTSAGAGSGYQNDMMQLTEQFMQQHYQNMLAQGMPTLPLLTQQHLANYIPTSMSWMGIPILLGRSDAAPITQAQSLSFPGLQIPPPTTLTRPSAPSITSTSLSVISQSQAESMTTSQLSGLQFPSAPALITSSSTQCSLTSTSSTVAPHHITLSTTQTTQTSPSAPTVSTPRVTSHSTGVSSSSQNSVCGQVSQRQTSSASAKSQAPTEENMFPKGPHFITLSKHPEHAALLTQRLNTAASYSHRRLTTNTVSSFVQPHASLLAPEFRRRMYNFTSFETTTTSNPLHVPAPTSSVANYMSSFPIRTLDSQGISDHTHGLTHSSPIQSWTGTNSRSVSSPLNLDHPVGAAVSALLSLSDRTNSRSPRRYTTASPLPSMSDSSLTSSYPLARSFTIASECGSTTTCTTVALSSDPLRGGAREGPEGASGNVLSPLATTTTITSTAGGVSYTTSSGSSPHAPIITFSTSISLSGIRVMAVPDAVRCSEDLSEDSETMKLSREKTVALQKVDGPSLIGTDDTNDDELPYLAREASIESNLCLNPSGSVNHGSMHSTTTPSPRGQKEGNTIDLNRGTPEQLANEGRAHIGGAGIVTIENNNSSAAGDSQDETDSRQLGKPPRKQPKRKAATKQGIKNSTRQRRTANSKNKT